MTDKRTFDTLGYLLNLYSGVSLAFACQCDDGKVLISFRCHSFESLKAIAYASVGANVAIEVAGPWRVCGEGKSSDDVRFTILISDDWTSDSPPSVAQVFGAYLMKDLQAKRLLSSEHARALKLDWNIELR